MERIVLEFPQFPLKQDQSDKFWVLPPPQNARLLLKGAQTIGMNTLQFLTGIGEKKFQ